jgi:hypothetical protein
MGATGRGGVSLVLASRSGVEVTAVMTRLAELASTIERIAAHLGIDNPDVQQCAGRAPVCHSAAAWLVNLGRPCVRALAAQVPMKLTFKADARRLEQIFVFVYLIFYDDPDVA